MKRKYELKERARRQAETRERIVEATVELHTSIGPARTTISAIAQHAGVERHTVYAHFADERTLFEACTTHWAERHPFPNPESWAAIEEPQARLRVPCATSTDGTRRSRTTSRSSAETLRCTS